MNKENSSPACDHLLNKGDRESKARAPWRKEAGEMLEPTNNDHALQDAINSATLSIFYSCISQTRDETFRVVARKRLKELGFEKKELVTLSQQAVNRYSSQRQALKKEYEKICSHVLNSRATEDARTILDSVRKNCISETSRKLMKWHRFFDQIDETEQGLGDTENEAQNAIDLVGDLAEGLYEKIGKKVVVVNLKHLVEWNNAELIQLDPWRERFDSLIESFINTLPRAFQPDGSVDVAPEDISFQVVDFGRQVKVLRNLAVRHEVEDILMAIMEKLRSIIVGEMLDISEDRLSVRVLQRLTIPFHHALTLPLDDYRSLWFDFGMSFPSIAGEQFSMLFSNLLATHLMDTLKTRLSEDLRQNQRCRDTQPGTKLEEGKRKTMAGYFAGYIIKRLVGSHTLKACEDLVKAVLVNEGNIRPKTEGTEWETAYKFVEFKTKGGLLYARIPFVDFVDRLLTIAEKGGYLVLDNDTLPTVFAVAVQSTFGVYENLMELFDKDLELTSTFDSFWATRVIEIVDGDDSGEQFGDLDLDGIRNEQFGDLDLDGIRNEVLRLTKKFLAKTLSNVATNRAVVEVNRILGVETPSEKSKLRESVKHSSTKTSNKKMAESKKRKRLESKETKLFES
jgi:hypothetical protein